MSTIISTNPATGVQIKTYDLHTDEMIADRLEAAQKTWQEWRQVSFAKRSELMMEAAQVLESKKETYAKIMTAEMGKTYRSAIAEVEKCAWVCRYYAENAAGFLADEFIDTDATKSGICYQPLGVILAVMPWNYPMWQVFRFAAPALMAGNVAVLKHASNVPESALRIEEVFRLAGFPKGAFNTLLIKSDQVKAIIENPVVKAVTLTGSEGAGAAVSAAA
ncbi:MAG: aldehyde dehydrogenase family protein, partial [Saprospiraceae bacterium]|nr:aldehyde dehydrogenase family protein [Saprospiraceae bacterium]